MATSPHKLLCPQSPSSIFFTTPSLPPSIPFNYPAISQRILLSSIPIFIETTIHTGKIVRQIAKLLQLNIFECSLMNYALTDNLFLCKQVENNKAIQQLLKFDESVYSNRRYTEVFVLMLFNGYYAKSVANRHEEMEGYFEAVKRMIPSFGEAYEAWEERKTFRKVSLVDINMIFKKNSFLGPREEVIENYNAIVDQILDMAKPYANKNSNENQNVEEVGEEEEVVENKKREKEKEGENSLKEKKDRREKKNMRIRGRVEEKRRTRGQRHKQADSSSSSKMQIEEQEQNDTPPKDIQKISNPSNIPHHQPHQPHPQQMQQQQPPYMQDPRQQSLLNNSTYRNRDLFSSNHMIVSLGRSKKYQKIGNIPQQPPEQSTLFNFQKQEKLQKDMKSSNFIPQFVMSQQSNQQDRLSGNGMNRFSVRMLNESGKNSLAGMLDSFKLPELGNIRQVSMESSFHQQLIKPEKPEDQLKPSLTLSLQRPKFPPASSNLPTPHNPDKGSKPIKMRKIQSDDDL